MTYQNKLFNIDDTVKRFIDETLALLDRCLKPKLDPNRFYLVYELSGKILLGIVKYRVYDYDFRCLIWYFFDPRVIKISTNCASTVASLHEATYQEISPKDFPLYAYLTATCLGEQWYKHWHRPFWRKLLTSIIPTG